MILSASRRTDIPCFYGEWFMNRIRAGYVLTRNPMNHAQLSRVQLSPEIVDCIVFWTKDPSSFLPCLDELNALGYRYYFQFTLTPYNRSIEPGLRNKSALEDTFIELSKRIGRDRVIWRYDPIILNDVLSVVYHKKEFARMRGKLSGFTDTVTISFVDLYAKLKTPLIRAISENEIAELAGFIGETAKTYGIRPVACCENDLTSYGIEGASCIDLKRIEQICGCKLDLKPDKNQRSGCGCVESIDIGAYNTCMNGCVYCYANDTPLTTRRRYDAHDPTGEILVGKLTGDEKITERAVRSNKIN
ncbi:MAG TPA: DUF1848 domain-containing protein [Oscillospiraceae bacterium]|nr:DUF1848 domain-containing protein [Oscillospiraceae bacterium]HPF56673.1 DUF1848 domain-containing protein [Clostridiales bacterium]HPK36561.1 DUF1848 domain-containing protein [Oscillospiraceae bacterium]HPR76643.1 DUF1848 domain-containing protein [Oscillospiraceae bacterium]